MNDQLNTWLNFLTQRNRSAGTLQAFRWEMERLINAHPTKTQPADYTTAELLAYLAARKALPGKSGEGLTDSALKRSTVALKSFFKWALGDQSPMKGVPTPKPKKKLHRTLDWEKAFEVLTACDTSTPVGVRDLALMTLMIDTGLRAAEVCRLRLDRINFEKRVFVVRVKGGDEKAGIYSPETANYLQLWLAHRALIAKPETPTLFCAVGGLHPGQPLTTDGLRIAFRYLAKRAGLTGGFAPHDLRRTFATLATELGAPTDVVRRAGRWETLHQVLTYTQAVGARQIERYLPVAKMMGFGGGED